MPWYTHVHTPPRYRRAVTCPSQRRNGCVKSRQLLAEGKPATAKLRGSRTRLRDDQGQIVPLFAAAESVDIGQDSGKELSRRPIPMTEHGRDEA